MRLRTLVAVTAAGVFFWMLGGRLFHHGDDVLLITVDTLRADRLSCYGAAKPTPTIDGLAASGALFEQASTNIPRTTPSIATLFTGRYPQSHGVRFLRQPLDASESVLAERMAEAGFRTGALVAGGPLEEGTGLSRGFGTYRCYVDLKAGLLTIRALPWIFWNLPRRSFLWMHYFDPHFGYQPPWPYGRGMAAPKDFHLYGDLREHRVSFGELHFSPRLSQEDHVYLRNLYQGEVAYTDAAIGVLLAAVRLRDWITGGSSLVVLSADHGESLGEHGCWYEHGELLYETDVRIPLLLSWPGRIPSGRRSDTPAETIDIAPTMLDLLGLPPLVSADGRSLAPGLKGQRLRERPVFVESGESFFPENSRRQVAGIAGKWRSVRLGEWKLIMIPVPHGDATELYDLRRDPFEGEDRAGEAARRAAAMKTLLDRWIETGHRQGAPGPELDEEAREKLRSLGYLDNPTPAVPKPP